MTSDELRRATGGFDGRRKSGEGGFGRIYLALQKPLMVKVALKRLRLENLLPIKNRW